MEDGTGSRNHRIHTKGDEIMKPRIYIAGPITGTSDYESRFRDYEASIRDWMPDAEVVNPVRITEPIQNFSHEEIMRVCIAALSCCNMIFLMRGWENSEGAKEELQYVYDHPGQYSVIRDLFIFERTEGNGAR